MSNKIDHRNNEVGTAVLDKDDSREDIVESYTNQEYKYGFVTDIEVDTAPPGLNEDIIRLISAKKKEPEFLLEWRLKSYRHWLTMEEPRWPNVHYSPIDYQNIIYYAAPKQRHHFRQKPYKVERG